jgi:hypothetical protein
VTWPAHEDEMSSPIQSTGNWPDSGNDRRMILLAPPRSGNGDRFRRRRRAQEHVRADACTCR